MTIQDEDLLARLLLQWEELAERGQDSSAKDLTKGRPDLVDELERRIQALKATSWLITPSDDDPRLTDYESDDPDHDPHPSPSSRPLGRRYRLESLVGEGGFAQVYRAYDLGLHRTVAVKIPKPTRNELASTFLEEARRIAGLKHESIVAVYDVGVEDRNAFIVSEFMEGGNLAQRLANGALQEDEAVRWIAAIADALQYAHDSGVLHRDLKPANILSDHHGHAKLADFGIAGETSGSGGASNHFGTLNYMSPEHLSSGEGDARSDVYGLGVVMYEALTGRPPPAPSSRGRGWLADVPKGLRKVCEKALSHDPAVRHASAGEFADDLRGVGTRRQRKRAAIGVMGISAVAVAFALLAPQGIRAVSQWWKTIAVTVPDTPQEPLFLSDLAVRQSLVGWDRLHLGRVTEHAVNGIVGEKVIVAHAPSRVVFNLPPAFDGSLTGAVGIAHVDLKGKDPCSCIFKLYGDDTEVWRSDLIGQDATTRQSIVQSFSVALHGYRTITLEVDSVGANLRDWSVWIDPVLVWTKRAD